MMSMTPNEYATPLAQRTQLRKRRSDADEDSRTRVASPSPFGAQPHATSAAAPAPLMARNPLELRAFGLEDRADAVISSGAADWSLKNLSQWRQEMAQHAHGVGATAPAVSSKAYIAQRQREFKQQMLRSSRPSVPPSSTAQ